MSHMPLAALPGPVAGSAPVLSRKAKAAIIVQFLLTEGADVPLSALPESQQAELTALLGAMRYIDRDTLNAVVMEFADELEQLGLSFPGDMAGALSALDGKISAQTAKRLRKEAGVRQTGDPWERINGLEPERLANIVGSESTEIAAVMLSKIDVAKAAQVLSKLPGEKARKISMAISLTTDVTPDAVDRIGLSLASQLDAQPAVAFKSKPPERLGAILNYSGTAERDEILEKLEQEDAEFAEAVRRAIFTFANIPERLKKEDVPKITRDVPAEVMATAVAGSKTDVDRKAADFLLANMSKRLATAVREEAEAMTNVKTKAAEAAQSEVVTAIRDLASTGEISFAEPEEEDD